MKILREWTIPVPWGKLALISFGNPSGEPVLVVHGRQDSAATFLPLLDLLPDTYHYVALDMPGHGKSDPFPNGVKVKRIHFLGSLEMAVQHLGWTHFTFIAHSMGCEQGLFFNAVYPDIITRMVLLDAGPSLFRLQIHDPAEHQAMFYDEYYDNYDRDNFRFKVYTKEQALNTVMRARGLNEEQAEIVLSRNLIQMGEGKYRLSWDGRLKQPAALNNPNEYYFSLFKNIPPTLLIAASEGSRGLPKWKKGVDWLINEMSQKLDNFQLVTVDGTHDVHLIHPERVAPYIRQFLDKGFGKKAKL